MIQFSLLSCYAEMNTKQKNQEGILCINEWTLNDLSASLSSAGFF